MGRLYLRSVSTAQAVETEAFQSMMDSYIFSLGRKRNSVKDNGQKYIGDYI